MDTEALLSLSLDIGEEMLLSGAEIHRVEDCIRRICHAYEAKRIDVFSITSVMIATIESPEGQSYTQTRRIAQSGTDLTKLHRLNCLSRTLCSSTPSLDFARREFQSILSSCRPLEAPIFYLSYFLIAGSFTLFFGGTLLESAFSALIAMVLCLAVRLTGQVNFNPILSKIMLTFLFSLLAILCARVLPGVAEDKIIIGNIMIVIPGIGLTNSLRDLFSGDLISGLLRLCESCILALAIAAGYSLAVLLTGGIA